MASGSAFDPQYLAWANMISRQGIAVAFIDFRNCELPSASNQDVAPFPAGLDDCYTSSRGHTRTCGNFVKACFFALQKSYGFLTPDLWSETVFIAPPFQQHTDFLKNYKEKPAYEKERY